jgi:uncharacterized repeat protein (TIGR03803 family)
MQDHVAMTRHIRTALALLAVMAMLVAGTALLPAQTLTVLHAFTDNPDGKTPLGNVAFDAQGNLVGAASRGGATDSGVVFRIDTNGNEEILLDIGTLNGPIAPLAGVAIDSRGNIFGTTTKLFDDFGSVWKLSPNGAARYLHIFTGGDDGGYPMYPNLTVTRAASAVSTNAIGSLDVIYGVAAGYPLPPCSAVGLCGTLFKLDQRGNFTTLHTFGSGEDGQTPFQGMVQDSQGNLFGTTTCGGTFDGGTVFEWTADGSYQVLYNLPLGGGGDQCGSGTVNGPEGPGSLQIDAAGNLYGGTWHDGAFGFGNVFKLTNSGGVWSYASLYDFSGGNDGGAVRGGLTIDSSGNLYGTATGGANGQGTIFEITSGGTFRTLYDFSGGTDGKTPNGGMIFDASGNLYGTTTAGGDATCHCGVVYRLSNLSR